MAAPPIAVRWAVRPFVVQEVLRPFELAGVDEEGTELFIADAWAGRDWSSQELAAAYHRVMRGRGPRDSRFDGLSPTRKHWSRPHNPR